MHMEANGYACYNQTSSSSLSPIYWNRDKRTYAGRNTAQSGGGTFQSNAYGGYKTNSNGGMYQADSNGGMYQADSNGGGVYRSAATYQSSEGIRSRVEYWPSTYSWNPPYANVSRAPGDQQHVINRLGKQHVRSRWEEDQSIRTQDNRVPPKPVEHPKMTSGLFRSPNLPNTYVCILGENGQKTFKGTFRIKVLAGLVHCFGHIFKPSDDWHEMFSPSITLGLSLSGVPTSDVRLSREEFAILSQLNHRNLVFVPYSSTIPSTYPGSRTPAFGDRRRERAAVEIGLPKEDCTVINEAIKREFRGGSVVAVFLLERNKSPLIPFLLHTQIRNTFEEKPDPLPFVQKVESTSTIQVPVPWYHIASDLSYYKGAVILVLGKVNLGKSTFSRFVINSLLNRHKQVGFLECDVGQTEFTPPGIISVHLIKKPVTGPAFTHQRTPHMAHYYGDNTPSAQPDYYIHCIHSLMQHFEKEVRLSDKTCPLVVNTCGWLRDLGVALAIDIIRIVKPTHIVRMYEGQVTSRVSLMHSELPELTSDYLETAPGFLTRGCGTTESGSGTLGGGVGIIATQNKGEGTSTEDSDVTVKWDDSSDISVREQIERMFEISGLSPDLEDEEAPLKLPQKRPLPENSAKESEMKKQKVLGAAASPFAMSRQSALARQTWKRVGKSYLWDLKGALFRKSSRDHRLLSTLAYFSQMFSKERLSSSGPLPSYTTASPDAVLRARPYTIPFSAVAVHVLRCEVPRSKVLVALNGNLVSLCKVDQSILLNYEDEYPGIVKFVTARFPMAEHIGFGLVRCVDVSKRLFYIVTPEPPERLQKVNLLMMGRSEIPSPFLQNALKGSKAPYKNTVLSPSISFITNVSFKQQRAIKFPEVSGGHA